MSAGDPWCPRHGFAFCNCREFTLHRNMPDFKMDYADHEHKLETYKLPTVPTLTPSQATTLYQLMAAACVGGYWVPDKEEYDAIKAVLWAISENKEC